MSGIAERLAAVRRTAGTGVRGFASAIAGATGYRISHTSVANYESGTTVPAVYTVAVARTFGVDLKWLLTGEGLAGRIESPPARQAVSEPARRGAEAGIGAGVFEGAGDARPVRHMAGGPAQSRAHFPGQAAGEPIHERVALADDPDAIEEGVPALSGS